MIPKTVLITGASSGIGKETAKALLKAGHTVFAAARRIDMMKDLEDLGGITVKTDITIDDDINRLIEIIYQKSNGLDVLINNAGFAIYGSVEETPIDDAKSEFEVNVFGLARLTQKIIPHMRQKSSGSIIIVGSMAGRMYTPLGAWYHASKYALEGWTDCLRIELKQFGINVSLIEPGIVNTEFGKVMTEPMMKRSGSGPYSNIADFMAWAMTDYFHKPYISSHSSVVARDILKVVESKNPKTRYLTGKYARTLIYLRNLLGDRLYDKLIMILVKKK